MPRYEYQVVPAPVKGLKARGVKTPESRFANTLQDVMNRMGAEGWEYQRAEMLPSTERSGLTGSTTTYRNVLVFRRARADDISMSRPVVLEPVTDATDDIEDLPEPVAEIAVAAPPEPAEAEQPGGQPGAIGMLRDNGVEELSDVAGMTHALKKRASQKKST